MPALVAAKPPAVWDKDFQFLHSVPILALGQSPAEQARPFLGRRVGVMGSLGGGKGKSPELSIRPLLWNFWGQVGGRSLSFSQSWLGPCSLLPVGAGTGADCTC